VRSRASGRLDLLGGVADYSGALVLQVATRQGIEVQVEPEDALVVGPLTMKPAEIEQLAELSYAEIRRVLQDMPRWTHYPLGVALVLVRAHKIDPPTGRLTISSNLPQSMGVASSAALEVATARALGAQSDGLELAKLCQEAENHVVGAPCGVMDQVSVTLGRPDCVLPILCRPASVQPSVRLGGIEVLGWPTHVAHDVSGAPYARARAASFMGKRIVEVSTGHSWKWVSQLPFSEVSQLPELIDGAAYLDRWSGVDDEVTTVDPGETYRVRAATTFGVMEHGRAKAALACLRRHRHEALGPLMEASDRAYREMGLGHPAAVAIVEEALARPGVLGARLSGGGCGGTVVVACRPGALDDIGDVIR